MFDYDKIIKKLGKFDELSDKKKKKVFNTVFCSEEFREWFYGVGENKDAQPMNGTMVQKLYNLLTRPVVVKPLTTFIEESDHESFDRTSCSLAFLVVDQGIESLNKANEEISDESKTGSMGNKEIRSYKEKSDRYTEYMAALLSAIKDKASHEVKDVCRRSNLPKTLVYTTYLIVPGRKYVPKYKVSMYMNQLLREIYKYVGSNGLDDIEAIRWGSLFGSCFGNEMTASAAVSILLEGVKRIETYQNTEHFNDVRSVWDSLTNFALSELDNAPENIRRQMLEIYIKKIDRLFKNGNGPRLRVNLLQIPSDFRNLISTVTRYSDRIGSITRTSLKPVADIKRKYVDEPRRDRDEDDDDDSDLEIDRRLDSNSMSKIRDDRREERRRDREKFFEKMDEKGSNDDEDDQIIKGVKKAHFENIEVDRPNHFDDSDDEDDDASAAPPYFEESDD